MSNAKADVILRFSRNEIVVLRMIGMQLIAQGAIGALRKSTLLVDQGNNIHRLAGNQVQDPLIIFEGNMLPIDMLVIVLFLFELEDMMDEKLLQILVRIVDA